jgi:hypothetical protein
MRNAIIDSLEAECQDAMNDSIVYPFFATIILVKATFKFLLEAKDKIVTFMEQKGLQVP